MFFIKKLLTIYNIFLTETLPNNRTIIGSGIDKIMILGLAHIKYCFVLYEHCI